MISIVRHNCNGFINHGANDVRAKLLAPLALLLDQDAMKINDRNTTAYKKACDLYVFLTEVSAGSEYKRLGLLAAELRLKYGGDGLRSYNLLSEDELAGILDFIDTYGGFRVFQ